MEHRKPVRTVKEKEAALVLWSGAVALLVAVGILFWLYGVGAGAFGLLAVVGTGLVFVGQYVKEQAWEPTETPDHDMDSYGYICRREDMF